MFGETFTPVPGDIHPFFAGRPDVVEAVRQREREGSTAPVHFLVLIDQPAVWLQEGVTHIESTARRRTLRPRLCVQSMAPEYGTWAWRIWQDDETGHYVCVGDAVWREHFMARTLPEYNPEIRVTPADIRNLKKFVMGRWVRVSKLRGCERAGLVTIFFEPETGQYGALLTRRGEQFIEGLRRRR
jgi:hypothetical protein